MYSGHGLLAAVALLIWLPVTAVLFATLSPARAAMASVLGALLFLPEQASFDLPLLPALNKSNLPYLYILAVCAVRCPKRLLSGGPGPGFYLVVGLLFVSNITTALTNSDPLVYGTWVTMILPGLDVKDGLAVGVSSLLEMALPVYLGAVLFRDKDDLRVLFRGLVVAALIYSLLMLVEIRLSPQLHRWVYGYAPHLDFGQVLRWGGYRPMVFMAHGLAVGLFALLTTMAATAMARCRMLVRGISAAPIALYLVIILVLCKSTGAIVYAMFLLPLIRYARPRTQLRVAMALSLIVFLYPLLRSTDMFPVYEMLDFAGKINMERQHSLAFRFENEDMLLRKALERIWFGWGSYGRNSIYDSLMGREIAISDGYWIILLGIQGVIGFVGAFTILLTPVFSAARHVGKLPDLADRRLVAGLALMVAVAGVDLLPNGLFSNYPYFLAGALLGLVKGLRRGAREGEDSTTVTRWQTPRQWQPPSAWQPPTR